MNFREVAGNHTLEFVKISDNQKVKVLVSQLHIEEETGVITAFSMDVDTDGDGQNDHVAVLHLAEKQKELNFVQQVLQNVGALRAVSKGIDAGVKAAQSLLALFNSLKKIRIFAITITAMSGLAGAATALLIHQLQMKIAEYFMDWMKRDVPLCYRSQSGEDVFYAPVRVTVS